MAGMETVTPFLRRSSHKMSIRITTLSENTAAIGEFLGEWGLSILVETENQRVLLDTGKSMSTTYNADTLGIDLSGINTIVLSHGHYDHTGGLSNVLRRMRKRVEVIAHPDVWQLKYSLRKGIPDRYIGIPFQKTELESLGARFNLSSESLEINDTILTTGEVPMITDYEKIDEGLYVKEGDILRPDELLDDRALIVKSPKGLIIIAGCAHRGIINTLYHARNITGIEKIHAVIGGSHLMNTSEERIWQTIAAFREMEVEKLGLCHCTDLPAAAILAQEFGDIFFFNKAGTSILVIE
jgi:7,8-dihydropterin-6-yl-methyl-4-(beta-D-ribofuranosyl)aminobenzene 5'-phosphate synthase